MHSVFVSSIKVSVKSVAESMISKYANKVHNEMMIDWNGPEIGKCDAILKESLNHHFNGEKWHFNTTRVSVFQTSSGVATTKLFEKKSKLMIY